MNRVVFCSDDCKYLSLTEAQQNLEKKIPHWCRKVGERVLHSDSHANWHPKLIQNEACRREILFRQYGKESDFSGFPRYDMSDYVGIMRHVI